MTPNPKSRILCVDDEPQVLEGLSLSLRKYDLVTAASGAMALGVLAREPNVAVVISDMRMPGMDGATFLAQARQLAPNAVRMLLTGQADIESATAAINEGQIFRFLTKPCPPPTLLAAVAAAVEQHRLITAERVLLEQTVHGCIKTLTDVLALVSPVSFGRATRIKKLVTELADKLGLRERWQLEVAAMLSQLGYITLPPETAEAIYYGKPVSAEEQTLVDRVPAVTAELLGNIPRLEVIQEILKLYPHPYHPGPQNGPAPELTTQAAELLKVAIDFDACQSAEGTSAGLALETLRGRAGQYSPQVLDALAAARGGAVGPEVRELPVAALRFGMILAEDVKLRSGVLLVARGFEVNQRFIERLRNLPAGTLGKSAWQVIVPVDVAR